jgi:hypothetical protein
MTPIGRNSADHTIQIDLSIFAYLQHFTGDQRIKAWTPCISYLCVGGTKQYSLFAEGAFKVKEALAQTCLPLLGFRELTGTWMGLMLVRSRFGRVSVLDPALVKVECETKTQGVSDSELSPEVR